LGLLGGKALAEAVKHNYTLAVLDVTGNDIPEEYVTAIGIILGYFSYLEDSVILRNRDNVLFREKEHSKAKTLENQVYQLREEHDKYVLNLQDQLNKTKLAHQVTVNGKFF
jgi:hypothetical protein